MLTRARPITYGFDYFVFYVNTLQDVYIAKKSHTILMKIIFLQVRIEKMLYDLIEKSSNGINIICFIGIDQNVIQINSNKNI